jgi:endonuclease/exonuclease/phosphatase family metal-dependent hydrolase
MWTRLLRRALELVQWIERRPKVALGALVSVAIAISALAWEPSPSRSVAAASFNIENYPRSDEQIAEAFALIRSLDVAMLGVQEIRDPESFDRAARAHLGESWRFVYADGPHPQKVGLLYDSARFELLEVRTHRETLIGRRAKPALEVRLEPFDGGEVVRAFVVHLTSGLGKSLRRREQLEALAPAIERAVESGERVIVLGDFNATTDVDRESIAALAARARLEWSSESLGCTSYWRRRDGCRGAALDHVLSSRAIERIEAAGACATEGCAERERCPHYCDVVSDHCPVRFELP